MLRMTNTRGCQCLARAAAESMAAPFDSGIRGNDGLRGMRCGVGRRTHRLHVLRIAVIRGHEAQHEAKHEADAAEQNRGSNACSHVSRAPPIVAVAFRPAAPSPVHDPA